MCTAACEHPSGERRAARGWRRCSGGGGEAMLLLSVAMGGGGGGDGGGDGDGLEGALFVAQATIAMGNCACGEKKPFRSKI